MLFDTLFDTTFQITKKIKKGKHMKSRDKYFQKNLHSAFTALSNIQIIEIELISGKTSVLLFIFLNYGVLQHNFSLMFSVKDFC